MTPRIGVPLLGLLALAAAAGCASDPTRGYAVTSTFPPEVSTVAVSVFENDTYERDLQFELTDALIKEIEARTPYKVTSAGRADTILTGRISNVRRRQLSKSRFTGLSEEVAFRVTIDMEWRDLRTGEPLLELKSFSADSLFVPSRPSLEPIEIGEFGAVQALARDIVAEMRADW